MPFEAEFRCLYFTVPREAYKAYAPGLVNICNGKGANAHLLCGNDVVYAVLYGRLDKPVRTRERYTEADMQAFADQHGAVFFGGGVQAKDLFPHRLTAGMTNLHNGVLETAWHRDRLVLVGDSKHKMSPIAGLGFTNGMQDLAVLANLLRRLLETSPSPTNEQLGALFRRYEEIRRPDVASDLKHSLNTERMNAWYNSTAKIMDRYVVPRMAERLKMTMMRRVIGSMIIRGQVLDFVDADEPFKSKYPYQHPLRKQPSAVHMKA